MKRALLLFLVFGVGLSILPAKADPPGTNTKQVPNDSGQLKVGTDKTTVDDLVQVGTKKKGLSPWSAPTDKEHGLPKDVPIGDFDTVKPMHIQPSIQPSSNVRGKLMHKAPIGRVIPSLPPKTTEDSSQMKMYDDKHHPGNFAPKVGDFGPLPTNSYKQNKAVHPDDFQGVPVESGIDTRKVK